MATTTWFRDIDFFHAPRDEKNTPTEITPMNEQSEQNENLLMQIVLRSEKGRKRSSQSKQSARKKQKIQTEDDSDSLGGVTEKCDRFKREEMNQIKTQKLKRRPGALRNPIALVSTELKRLKSTSRQMDEDILVSKYDYVDVPTKQAAQKMEERFQSSLNEVNPVSGKANQIKQRKAPVPTADILPVKITKGIEDERVRTRTHKKTKKDRVTKEEVLKFSELFEGHQQLKNKMLRVIEELEENIPMSDEGRNLNLQKREDTAAKAGKKKGAGGLKIAVIDKLLQPHIDGFSERRLQTMFSRVRNSSFRREDRDYWLLPYLVTYEDEQDISPVPFAMLKDINFPMPEVVTRAKANSILRSYRDNERPCVKGADCCVFKIHGHKKDMKCLPMLCTERETQQILRGETVERKGGCLLCFRKDYTSLFTHNMVFKTVAKRNNEPPLFYEETEVPGEYPAEYSICSMPDINMGFIHPIIAFNLFHYEFSVHSGEVRLHQRIPTPKIDIYNTRDPNLFSKKTLRSLEATQQACQREIEGTRAYPMHLVTKTSNPTDDFVEDPLNIETLQQKEARYTMEFVKKKNRNIRIEEVESNPGQYPVSDYLYRERIENILCWFWAHRDQLEHIYGKQEMPENIRRYHEDIHFQLDKEQEPVPEPKPLRRKHKKKGNRRVKLSASKSRTKNSPINYEIGKIYPNSPDNNFLMRMRAQAALAKAEPWCLSPFAQAVEFVRENSPSTTFPVQWDPLTRTKKPHAIYDTLVLRLNWALWQLSLPSAVEELEMDLWTFVDMHLSMALFFETYQATHDTLLTEPGTHRKTHERMDKFTPYAMYEPRLSTAMHEGELPDLSFYIMSAMFVSSDKMYIWDDDVLSAIAEVFIKIAPIPCKRRSSAETFTRIVTREPSVTNIFLRIIFCSLLGVYQHAKTRASFALRKHLHQNFSFVYPNPVLFGEWMKKNSFLVIFIMREYFCFVFERGLIAMDEMHAQIYYWDKIKSIVYSTMDEVRERMNDCFDPVTHRVDADKWETEMRELNNVYLEKVNKNKILPMSYRTPEKPFLMGVLDMCKTIDYDEYAKNEVDLSDHVLFGEKDKTRMREIVAGFPKDTNWIRTAWLGFEFGLRLATIRLFENGRLLYESETSRSAIRNVMASLARLHLRDYLILKNYLEMFRQHCSLVFYRLPYHMVMRQLASLKRVCRVAKGDKLPKYAGSFYFDVVSGTPKSPITWEADDGRNMYCAGNAKVSLDPISMLCTNAMPPKKTTAKNRCVSIESIEEEMIKTRKKIADRHQKDEAKLDVQIKKLFYKKIQDLKRSNQVLNHPLELYNMIGLAVRVNSMNTVLVMCPVCTNMTAFDYRKFKGTRFGCCIPKDISLETVSFGSLYMLNPFALYKTLKKREMELPPSCYYCKKNLAGHIHVNVTAKDNAGNPTRISLCVHHTKKWIVKLSKEGQLTIKTMLEGITNGWYLRSFSANKGSEWVFDPTTIYKMKK